MEWRAKGCLNVEEGGGPRAEEAEGDAAAVGWGCAELEWIHGWNAEMRPARLVGAKWGLAWPGLQEDDGGSLRVPVDGTCATLSIDTPHSEIDGLHQILSECERGAALRVPSVF